MGYTDIIILTLLVSFLYIGFAFTLLKVAKKDEKVGPPPEN